VTILKALGVLNPETGEPTARLDAVKSVDMVRFTEEAWLTEREKMIKTCSKCHSEKYAREQLAMGDSMMQKAVFRIEADKVTARAYCNIHALWKG
jgi:desulfoferrodoxin (superoxide reductase-like protein)